MVRALCAVPKPQLRISSRYVAGCGGQGTDADGAPASSQKVPWHFWVFAGAAVVYLGWRLIQGLWMLIT